MTPPNDSMQDSGLRVFVIPEALEGMRADRALSELCPDLSRSYVQSLIREGRAVSGGKPLRPSAKTAAGETVSLDVPEPEKTDVLPENIPLDILYEDGDVLVINKPKGMPVHPAPGHSTGTVVNAVLYHCGESLSGIGGVLRPGIVHRIDMNTTGSLIICKNDEAHRKIAEQLSTHSVRRIYKGIASGRLEGEGAVSGNIGRSPSDRKKMAVVKSGGKPAVTHYRALEALSGYTFLEFRLETGRTHQIRVHMAHIGHPLLGDDVYGAKKQPAGLVGQALHAETIGFIHPSTGKYMEFSAPLPAYFEALLSRYRAG